MKSCDIMHTAYYIHAVHSVIFWEAVIVGYAAEFLFKGGFPSFLVR